MLSTWHSGSDVVGGEGMPLCSLQSSWETQNSSGAHDLLPLSYCLLVACEHLSVL